MFKINSIGLQSMVQA